MKVPLSPPCWNTGLIQLPGPPLHLPPTRVLVSPREDRTGAQRKVLVPPASHTRLRGLDGGRLASSPHSFWADGGFPGRPCLAICRGTFKPEAQGGGNEHLSGPPNTTRSLSELALSPPEGSGESTPKGALVWWLRSGARAQGPWFPHPIECRLCQKLSRLVRHVPSGCHP